MGYYSKKDGVCSSLLRNETEKQCADYNSLFWFEKRITAEFILVIEKGPLEPWGSWEHRALPSRHVGMAARAWAPRVGRAALPPRRSAAPTAARAIFSLLPGRFGLCKAALRQLIPSGYANLPAIG